MTGPPDPQRRQRLAKRPGQPRNLGKIGKQPGAGMTHDTPPVRTGHNPRTQPATLHLVSALRDGPTKISAIPSFQTRGHFHVLNPPPQPPLPKGRG
jgi:hypothetical protein